MLKTKNKKLKCFKSSIPMAQQISVCKNCGKKFKNGYSYKRVMCSRSCNAKFYLKKWQSGKNHYMYGKKPPNYKGRVTTLSGSRKIKYWYVYDNEGNKVREHRLIMENLIGRKLKDNEVVHHIDGDGLNNNLDNLMLTTISNHRKLHMEGGGPDVN